MRYIHTLVPLLLFADMLFVRHIVTRLDCELALGLTFACAYISWNLFCWWLLQAAPYPLQLRIYRLGILRAVASYIMLIAFAILLVVYTHRLRYISNNMAASSALELAMPIVLALWITIGFAPFQITLARFQGADPEEVWKPKSA